ncbi:hypothetical protein BGZ81_005583 [Podila clonocystis]|nr:hypothetical protein BGZ81_005583 [Podila clonocystis]
MARPWHAGVFSGCAITNDYICVFDRVVNRRHGGWCFSLNRLAYKLLKGLGYTVQYTLARVCKPTNRSDPIVTGGLSHRLSIVRFADETKYAFDIGIGNTYFYPN